METLPRRAPRRDGSGRVATALALLLAAAPGACALSDVTIPAGEDRVVVEALLRAGADRQNVLLHRTVEDGVVRGVTGARVVVRDEASGAEVVFAPAGDACYTLDDGYTGSGALQVDATCYRSPVAAGRFVQPGHTYELRIELPGEGTVRGRTRVPGPFTLRGLAFSPAGTPEEAPACVLPPDTPFPLTWSRANGAWSYLVAMRVSGLREALAGRGIPDVPERLELTGLAVSETDTVLVVPGEVGVFDRFSQNRQLLLALRGGFPAGVDVELLVAAADRNYVNGVRGGRFNPSGQVRISSVGGAGAVGVFGSLVPLATQLRVRRDPAAAGLPVCATGG